MSFASFEEFQAVQQRKRNRDPLSHEKPASKETAQPPVVTKSSRPRAFIEQNEVQWLVIVLLALDSFLSFSYVILKAQPDAKLVPLIPTLLSLIEALGIFSTAVFVLELFMLLLLFRINYLLHFGYSIDTVVVCIQSFSLWHPYSAETKVLNVFRLWRFLRLFRTSLEEERNQRRVAVDEAEMIRSQARLAEVNVSRLNLELEKERESKRAVEDMLQNYKEEVETLNEALKIAAQDIAEAAQDVDVVSDDEGLDVHERQDPHESKSVSSKSNSSLNRYDHPPQRLVAFQINEDGSFEPK